MAKVFLKEGRDYSALHFHPWIFSGAIERIEGTPNTGSIVDVFGHDGNFVGKATISPSSQIRLRMVSFGEGDNFSAFSRVAEALEMRSDLSLSNYTNAIRIFNGEADGIGGLIIDLYDKWAVCQFNTPGAERMKNEIIVALKDSIEDLKGIYERSDGDGRTYEGLPENNRLLLGEEPPALVEIFEGDVHYYVDIRSGHKTGFYLDQRDNRKIVASFARDKDVLNVFSYTGGFGVAAQKAGAKNVTHVDMSEAALSIARKNTELNGFKVRDENFICGNAFDVLRKFRDSRASFDLIVLDPPKFADSKNSLHKAARGYKDISLLAMKLLNPGGILATFSCSGIMTPEIFTKVTQEAAFDAKRNFRVIKRLWQAADHPEGLFFPEGLYLKGLLLKHLI